MTRRLSVLTIPVLMAALYGCQDFLDKTGFVGTQIGSDSWAMSYDARTDDVWEALRAVARRNGSIDEEDAGTMTLTGERRNQGEIDGLRIRGRVIDKTGDEAARARLIMRVWWPGAACGGGNPEAARSYCIAVRKTLERWKGGAGREDPTITTGTEPALKEDEATAFFRLEPAKVFEVVELVASQNGAIEQLEKEKRFLRGVRKSKLEPKGDEVLAWVYDRTEGDRIRSKVSVRVRTNDGNKAQPGTARAYVEAIREELEKRYGKQE